MHMGATTLQLSDGKCQLLLVCDESAIKPWDKTRMSYGVALVTIAHNILHVTTTKFLPFRGFNSKYFTWFWLVPGVSI